MGTVAGIVFVVVIVVALRTAMRKSEIKRRLNNTGTPEQQEARQREWQRKYGSH